MKFKLMLLSALVASPSIFAMGHAPGTIKPEPATIELPCGKTVPAGMFASTNPPVKVAKSEPQQSQAPAGVRKGINTK